MEIEINYQNFWVATEGDFKIVPKPLTDPEFISPDGSKYWNTGDGVIRLSNHWGRLSRSFWSLGRSNVYEYITFSREICGFCAFKDMKPNSKIPNEYLEKFFKNPDGIKKIIPIEWNYSQNDGKKAIKDFLQKQENLIGHKLDQHVSKFKRDWYKYLCDVAHYVRTGEIDWFELQIIFPGKNFVGKSYLEKFETQWQPRISIDIYRSKIEDFKKFQLLKEILEKPYPELRNLILWNALDIECLLNK